ncbi:DUF6059 family protein [Streptomyces sp. NPDC056660]|uniref:DUF6059 family protein n=1 Tax=Streptomyces sp. NPDC056660 TaxID=3345897 RepID=UPI0036A67550
MTDAERAKEFIAHRVPVQQQNVCLFVRAVIYCHLRVAVRASGNVRTYCALAEFGGRRPSATRPDGCRLWPRFGARRNSGGMSLPVLRCLKAVVDALADFGRLWVHIPGLPPADPGDPAPGHPERLCPWVPPTRQERAIWDDVRG